MEINEELLANIIDAKFTIENNEPNLLMIQKLYEGGVITSYEVQMFPKRLIIVYYVNSKRLAEYQEKFKNSK